MMPLGLLVMVPDPPPAELTCRAYWLLTAVLNCAVTVRLDDKVTVQLKPLPVQAPDHPANCEPAAALAVSVTVVVSRKVALQVLPQLMPLGVLVTDPVPDPSLVTVSVLMTGTTSNCALTLRAWSMMTVQLLDPWQAPDHPTNCEPVAALAVSVTEVPCAKDCVDEGQ